MFVNYAHRGASHYAPENTLSAFYLGIQQGANGIETDIRRTRDGQLVLFHDATLERVAGISGGVGDYTLKQLSGFWIRGDEGKRFTPDRIVTLEQFLYLFAHRDLTFALEFKDSGVEADTLKLVDKYRIREKCIFTSFQYEHLVRMRELDPDVSIGYLTSRTDDEVFKLLRDIHGNQLCLKAETLTPSLVARCRDEGFGVRAWGVSDLTLMAHVCQCGADGGMTVNFPDKLTALLEKSRHPM